MVWISSILSFCKTLLIVLIILFLFFTLVIYIIAFVTRFRQGDFLYYPQSPDDMLNECVSPVTCGVANSEDVEFVTSDGVTLRGYIIWPSLSLSSSTCLQHENTSLSLPSSVSVFRSINRGVAVEGSGLLLQENVCAANTFPTCGTDGDDLPKNICNINDSSNISDTNNANNANKNKNSVVNDKLIDRNGNSNNNNNRNVNKHRSEVTEPNVIIYFHGNAGNVGHRIELAAHYVNNLHCAVMMVDYRGYGLSSPATIDQDGLEKDAEACLDYLHNIRHIPAKRIFVLGTSLGGAVAIHLASKEHNWRRIRGLIIENTFTSIADMVEHIGRQLIYRRVKRGCSFYYCVFKYYVMPLALMLRWNSIALVQKIPIPILFYSAACDEIVPSRQMRTLYKASQSAQRWRTLVTFAHGEHNSLYIQPHYMEYIYSFMHNDDQKFNVHSAEHDISPSTIVIE